MLLSFRTLLLFFKSLFSSSLFSSVKFSFISLSWLVFSDFIFKLSFRKLLELLSVGLILSKLLKFSILSTFSIFPIYSIFLILSSLLVMSITCAFVWSIEMFVESKSLAKLVGIIIINKNKDNKIKSF